MQYDGLSGDLHSEIEKEYRWFSTVMWSNLKIVTIQQIKSQVRDMVDDKYINSFAKNYNFKRL